MATEALIQQPVLLSIREDDCWPRNGGRLSIREYFPFIYQTLLTLKSENDANLRPTGVEVLSDCTSCVSKSVRHNQS